MELPTDERTFPGGDKAAAINNNCVACHSAGMVLNQPPLSRAEWAGEVHKMANVYKAPVSPEEPGGDHRLPGRNQGQAVTSDRTMAEVEIPSSLTQRAG